MDVQNIDHSPGKIVALGLSAGGYEAAGDFFDYISPNTGLVFVLIDHKDLEVEYSLCKYFQTHTDMTVVEITDGLRPRANTVYIMPSKEDVILDKGVFRTVKRNGCDVRTNIDTFFTSLAKSEGSNAVAIILSGMLKDGTEGMKEIKKQSGTTIAQNPETALYPSMPQSAIDAGVADFVLAPGQMAAFVLREIADEGPHIPSFHLRKDNLIKYFGNLDNLLNNLNRPILVLDKDLRIKGFGGAIQELLPVIDTDIGRKITDLNLRVDYNTLVKDVHQVFETSKNKEIQVIGAKGTPHLLRISSGDYAPAQDPICIISLIPLMGKAEKQTQYLQKFKGVAQFGIVMAHVDNRLRYTWILNPHPDFSAPYIIGKTDIELAKNEGTVELTVLKKRVLESGTAEEKRIYFPLSNGLISYSISANAIKNKGGQIIGVSTVGVELGGN